jgi:hypothetical protein
LHIISEPEAAAMYVLQAMDPHGIKVGDTFVVCDAGGGYNSSSHYVLPCRNLTDLRLYRTVDLISYTVSALHPFLKIKEAAPGTGSLCGSTFLNRIFAKMLRDRFGNDPGWDDEETLADVSFSEHETGVLFFVFDGEQALEAFDMKVKKSFAGDNSEDFFIIPGE